ncbi:RAD52 motif-containing protein 1-like isoform X2 [Eriocheir sinensis]|uniref:RAD52 motif-containing protein 1-like isoform X2 n=1 Tax=Eriocheir sinensis TaxID=95602 RepID=UPI0021C67CFD|nr:RAD52 motif-containing protein 1-like isoform X2 [Eriocheir sinensis]
MKDVDVIPFKVPQTDGHQVSVIGLRWDGSVECLEQEVRQVFELFGPLHRVTVKKDAFCPEDRDDAWYAYMTFFSRFDCEEALRHNGKILVLGHKVRVRKTKKTRAYKESLELSLHKSQELLIHYMGFNCWTSEIVHFERVNKEDLKDAVRYLCLVRIRMPREGLCSEGLGLGEAPLKAKSAAGRGESLSTARRFAFHTAMKAAFSKFIIIKLRNGKVTVEVDTTQTDLQIYQSAWDNPLVEVIDIAHDPEEEDSDDDDIAAIFEDMEDEELDNLLDVTAYDDV